MKKMSKKSLGYFRDIVRILLVLLVFSTLATFWHINKERGYFNSYIAEATELRLVSEDLSSYAREAVNAEREDEFKNLRRAYNIINQQIAFLRNGKTVDQKVVLPQSPESIKGNELSQYSSTWELVKPRIDDILNNQGVVISLNRSENRLFINLERVQDIYWDILKGVDETNIGNDKISMIVEQIDLIGDLLSDMQRKGSMTTFRRNLPVRMKAFFENVQLIEESTIQSLYSSQFKEIDSRAEQIRGSVDFISQNNTLIAQIQSSAAEVYNSSALISNLSDNLQDAFVVYPRNNRGLEYFAYILGGLSLVFLILLMYIFRKEDIIRLRSTEKKNLAMQKEIDNLLTELPEIASGSEPIDESEREELDDENIPESFYYALNTLKRLVYNIGSTANAVSEAALHAQSLTKELASSSGSQAQEIVEVTSAINSMASSIEQVSSNAEESATVALESVNIAGEGGKAVRGTVGGMERIQTQIQETANYMRRLSDSSQEIGEIVSLIDGIADQTNILSLNASIQAAMAGEAGRGFAVVADEVQRLAEKVSYATKEIGSLVRSIQTDTNQVIVAMDQTKAQVSEGVSSAQDAGSTLGKIETVSRSLSDLIQNISTSAKEQAEVSGRISHMMNDVKDIAKQTATGTMTTVDLIGNLAQYTTDLRNSVVEFHFSESKPEIKKESKDKKE